MRTLLLLSAICCILTACYSKSVLLTDASGRQARCEARGSGLIGATIQGPQLLGNCVAKYKAAGYVEKGK